MPRDLFRTVVHPDPGVGKRTRYALPLSIAIHAFIVLAMVIAPLMVADVLPSPPSAMTWLLAAPVSAPDVPPPAVPHTRAARPLADLTQAAAPPLEAPSGIREETGLIVDPEPAGGVPGSLPELLQGEFTHGLPEPTPPPPPPPEHPIRIFSGLKVPTKIRDVAPVYPAIAQAARVEGVVIVEAVIGSDGRVSDARILRSIPLLDQAALEAVRQWVFTPTLLGGRPVPIVMTVTVVFTLK